jgi:hypothetical protein
MEVVSEFPVDVEWPNSHRRGILTTGYPQNSSGIPVLVFDGKPHGPADLMPGTKTTAVWRKGRMGPVWTFLQKAIDAGYPIEVDPVG